MTAFEPTAPPVMERKLPVVELTMVSLVMMLSSGIYLAAHLPKPPPLAPAVGLAAAGGLLTVVAVLLFSRIRPFAFDVFFLVARWAFLGYLVIAGVLAFVFLYDHTSGGPLTLLLVSLAVFAIDVPLMIAFTVARYQQV